MQTAIHPAIPRAEALAKDGRVPEALLLLNQLAATGHKDALFALAVWRLAGRLIPRDLAQAREFFRRAGEGGRTDAAIIYTNFLANGTGGPSDWAEAVARLRKLASADQRCRRELEIIEKMELTPEGDPVAVPEGEPLSEQPLVRIFPKLLTSAECDYLVQAATPLLGPSVVFDSRTGRQIQNPVRTSDGAGFPWALENPAVHALNRRLAAVAGTKVDQGEPLQVLRYKPGQEYKSHVDAITGVENQRFLTMLVYLNDNYKGGETRFVKTGLAVKGRKGDALLFRNTLANGRPDPMAQHAGTPVKAGVKLIASRWIRERRFEAPDPGKPVA